MALDILRNSILSVDGFVIPGTVDVKVPSIKLKTEKMYLGGADGETEVDFGLQALEAGMKLGTVNRTVLANVGLRPGITKTFNFDGYTVSVVDVPLHDNNIRVTGKIREDDPGTWKHGDKSEWDYKIMCSTYKLMFGDAVIYDIDPKNFIRVIDGVDQLAEIRRAMRRAF